MGLEAECTVRQRGKAARGKAQLEAAELTFRGETRIRVPLAEVTRVRAERG